MSKEKAKVLCQNLWKIFGLHPESVLELADNGVTKQEVLEQTDHIIAVKDVSFEVHKNEAFVIMGLSGSGKSTLVRCLNRLIEPTKGTILIDGVDIADMNDAGLRELRRQKLSMVFQNFGLLPHRSVLDNIAFGLEIRGESRKKRQEKANNALELVGLKGWEKSRIYELSGGMQQRVGLARALAVGPEILLMDEPFSALDPLIRRQMQDEFINLRSVMKKTVVFITHDLLEALKLGDRIAIMRDGEIVQIGSSEDIVAQPADEYVSEFVKDVPRVKVIQAQSIMEEPSLIVASNASLEATIEKMKTKNVPAVFIMNPGGKIKGTVTMEQAVAGAQNGLNRAGEVAQPEFPSVPPDAPLEECLQLVANDETPVAVSDKKQRLLGIITRPALLQAILSDAANNNKS
jgi:glycine betaine/proline transport system ATP-binding protein